MTPAEKQCTRLVREADRDRYLATLFAPEAMRGALFALHAFGVEVARVADLVQEPLPGEIRLQWWRDAIAAGAMTGSPVADALIAAIEAHALPHAAFDQILDGTISDLYDDPIPDRTALEAWCGEVFSTPIQLAAMILDPRQAVFASTMAGHAGCALGIVRLLQSLPKHRARGRCWIPADILAASGVSREAVIAGEKSADGAVTIMVSLARDHLALFRRDAVTMDLALRPAFLPLAVTAASLDLIERATSPLDHVPEPSALHRQWLIWRRASGGWKP